MKILYSPVRSDDTIEYKYNGLEITCFINKEVYETYNAEEMIGINAVDYEIEHDVMMPVRAVWKDENDEYNVLLTKYFGFDAPYKERFPEWFEVE